MDILKTTHEGTNAAKVSKLQNMIKDFEDLIIDDDDDDDIF